MSVHRGKGWLRRGAGLLLVAGLLGLGGCGGGEADDANTPQPGADYFPLNLGDRWLYDSAAASTRVDVTGTRATVLGTATVVRSTDQDGSTELLALKSADGVTVVPASNADPLLTALGPLQLLRLPLAAGSRWMVTDRTVQALADIDGDGLPEDLSVRMETTVMGFEDLATSAGRFTRVAHLRTVLSRSVRLTGSGQVLSDSLTSDDWLAPDLGPVRSLVTPGPGSDERASDHLLSAWQVGALRGDTQAGALGGVADPAPAHAARLRPSSQAPAWLRAGLARALLRPATRVSTSL